MVVPFWKVAFPKLLNDNRFIEIMPLCLKALTRFFHQVKGTDTGISIIDATKLVVCHNLRRKRHCVFQGLARRGLKILTPSRANTKTKCIQTEEDKQLISRRGLIENSK